MKEVFYSDVLNQYFDSKKECHEAELKYYVNLEREKKMKKEAEIKAAEAEEKRKAELLQASNEKKELSKAIEDASSKVVEAEQEYELACDAYRKKVSEAREAYEKAIAEARQTTIVEASEKVNDAKKAKYEAVKAFNDKYGTYTVKYTGEQAYNEMKQAMNEFNKIFNGFFF